MTNTFRSIFALCLLVLSFSAAKAGNAPGQSSASVVQQSPLNAVANRPLLSTSLPVSMAPTLAQQQPAATAVTAPETRPVNTQRNQHRTTAQRSPFSKLKTLSTAVRSIRMAQRATAGVEHNQASEAGTVLLVLLLLVLLILLLGFAFEFAAALLYVLLVVLLVLLILWLVALI